MVNERRKVTFQSIIKWICVLIASVVLIMVLFVFGARIVTYFTYDISSENGVDEGQYVVLGGQEQYLLIRGENVSNPVIIWLHGGPAGSDAFVNHIFQKYLVDDYTIINWDQRGCGRTYYRNIQIDPNNETATFEQAQIDLDELVDYACMRFEQEKVIIIGHSYGTMLGSKYVLEHPEKVSAYIGVGQVVNIESDIYSYEDALSIAKENGDDTSEMEAAYQAFLEDRTLENMLNLRNYTGVYHVAEKEPNLIVKGIVSPYMGVDDVRWQLMPAVDLDRYLELNCQLFDYVMETDVRDYGLEYQVPVGFISGSQDWTTPVKYSEDYYNLIEAPEKQFKLIDGCGHSPEFADPEMFCDVLKNMLDRYIEVR